MEMIKVKECKLLDPLKADENESVTDVAKALAKAKVRQLTVTSNDKPVGIISAVDIVSKVIAEEKDPTKTPVKDVMTTPIISCDASEAAYHVYTDLAEKNIVSCPVVENGKFIGTITIQTLAVRLNQRSAEIAKQQNLEKKAE